MAVEQQVISGPTRIHNERLNQTNVLQGKANPLIGRALSKFGGQLLLWNDAVDRKDHNLLVERRLLLCALAGTTWYFQFFVYTMGESQMGRYGFSSWTLHMASIIIFSTLWGVALQEWRGSSKKTHLLITAGIAILILSTVIVGYGNMLATGESAAPATIEEPVAV